MSDLNTLLQWEKKNTTAGSVSNVNNTYQWSSSGIAPDGNLFTDFLGKLNNCTSGASTSVGGVFAGRCDWRIPNHVELQTILDCFFSPCINPIFGPTQIAYWSSATRAGGTGGVWVVVFGDGFVGVVSKTFFSDFARAVRGGR